MSPAQTSFFLKINSLFSLQKFLFWRQGSGWTLGWVEMSPAKPLFFYVVIHRKFQLLWFSPFRARLLCSLGRSKIMRALFLSVAKLQLAIFATNDVKGYEFSISNIPYLFLGLGSKRWHSYQCYGFGRKTTPTHKLSLIFKSFKMSPSNTKLKKALTISHLLCWSWNAPLCMGLSQKRICHRSHINRWVFCTDTMEFDRKKGSGRPLNSRFIGAALPFGKCFGSIII